jgi:ribosomal protein S18 acetylase RimI-like enzyme
MTWLARRAVPADHDAYARLFPELGVPDPTPDRAQWEAEQLAGTLFIDHAGAPVAYVYFGQLGDDAFVYNLVVDPACRGRGLGGVLMAAVADRLRAAGCRRWHLNVVVDNAPAIRLYERCGMAREHRSTALELAWEGVAALPREGAPVMARLVEPADDATLEVAFQVLRGRLENHRARGRVLLQLVDPARPEGPPLGLASFDPSWPGAFPFRVARPALAAPLLDALRAHARPSETSLRVVVERDAALIATLRDPGGATVIFELVHMSGAVPERS